MFPSYVVGIVPTQEMARLIKQLGTGNTVEMEWSTRGDVISLLWGKVYVAAYDVSTAKTVVSGNDVVRLYDNEGRLMHEFERQAEEMSTNQLIRIDRAIRLTME